ncbi:pkb-activating kinase-like protein [Ceratobasidium sp. 428]|nr:pkb-activating kinase-like protein [Ceratobasidium sp. 428]
MAGLAGAGGQSGEGKVYAVKVSDKQYLINKGKVKYANVEKTALALLGTGNQHRGHPGIVKLYWTFHDPMSLYFVLDLVPNGELLGRIKRLGSLTADGARYYTAQIVDAVGWMHGMGVVHRDLKPENILLDESFRVKITDFGSARVESGSPEVPSAPGTEGGGSAQPAAGVVPDQRASSFVGTAEYVSPELLIHNVTSRCSDVWAIGCILFQMLAGRPPFKGGSEYLTLEQVKRLEYTIPDGFDEVAAELVRSILVLNPASRPSIPSIRTHPFLAETVWDEIWTCDAPPMESGPVMGPPPPDSDEDEDVGEAWDRMVGADDDEDDDEEEEGGPMYFGPRHQGGDGGYQAGMAFRGVRMYGMGVGAGADGAGDSTDDGVTPQAVQRPSYNFGEYKFGDAGAGETSTVPIPTTEDVPAPTQERDITEQPVVVVGPMRTEPGPIGLPTRLSLPPTLPVILSPGLTDTDNEIAVEDDDMVPELQSTNALTDQRARTDPLRASHSSTISGVGTTSSSEGSPLGSTVGARAGSGEGMPIVGGDVEGLRTALAVMGLGSDAERLSSALAPGERPVFMSSILSRPRHRLTAVLPSKRRILVLTNTPRLLCMKEQRDRVVVKSELAFLGPATRPASVKSASSTGTPTTITGRGRSLARWKSTSSAPGGGSAGSVGSSSGAAVAAVVSAGERTGPEVEPIALETVQSVETKGEKSFIIQTLSKAYTYVADNPEEATRWVQQIKEAQNRKPRRASMLSSRPN